MLSRMCHSKGIKCWSRHHSAKLSWKGFTQLTRKSTACCLRRERDSSGPDSTLQSAWRELNADNATKTHHHNHMNLQQCHYPRSTLRTSCNGFLQYFWNSYLAYADRYSSWVEIACLSSTAFPTVKEHYSDGSEPLVFSTRSPRMGVFYSTDLNTYCF